MDNQIINKAIGIVTQAIAADNNGDHKAAYDLYTRALEHFMLGLKCACTCLAAPRSRTPRPPPQPRPACACAGCTVCPAAVPRLGHAARCGVAPHLAWLTLVCAWPTDETNPSARDVILKKLQGYMTRAEQLKKSIESNAASPAASGGGGGAAAEAKSGGGKEDNESAKLKGALAGASHVQ